MLRQLADFALDRLQQYCPAALQPPLVALAMPSSAIRACRLLSKRLPVGAEERGKQLEPAAF